MICSVLYELNGKNEDYLKIPLKKKKGSIIMRDWAKEIREDGEKAGEKNGEKRGMEKGMEFMIRDNFAEGKTPEQVKEKLKRYYKVDEKMAEEALKKYSCAEKV